MLKGSTGFIPVNNMTSGLRSAESELRCVRAMTQRVKMMMKWIGTAKLNSTRQDLHHIRAVAFHTGIVAGAILRHEASSSKETQWLADVTDVSHGAIELTRQNP